VGGEDDVEAGKIINAYPIPIHEQGFITNCRATRFEMQAFINPHWNHLVTVALQYASKLLNARVAGPRRPSYQNLSAGSQAVASIDCGGERDPGYLSVSRELSLDRCSLSTPR